MCTTVATSGMYDSELETVRAERTGRTFRLFARLGPTATGSSPTPRRPPKGLGSANFSKASISFRFRTVDGEMRPYFTSKPSSSFPTIGDRSPRRTWPSAWRTFFPG